ncbi:hypothetical protein ACES2I_05440 [Bdellovibrio bacteriovorus]|uniref:hypothetical protein n=1 Tax=Bdellovibrio bacteriovorus TaxID=959 RepID=UPI0035A60A86
MRYLMIVAVALALSACATKKTKDLDFDDLPAEKKAAAKSSKSDKVPKADANPAEMARNSGIVVDPQDLALLDRMTKAVELYVHKGNRKEFNTLCKDKRFDCFVNDKYHPPKKKKTARGIPPYASGSKMGLQGEERIQLRYEFYP